ncbi:histidine phosphatase family protein [Candidatus Woesebacteria bacterium]|nr:histidine phosphatase family protein [Candidatus Woesebacteria bacterium]MCB9801559.1 histidine phosphatase family protein [Pseudomonadales bacterium]
MKLIVVRHGETEENKEGIIQGHLPGTLSPLGREQAQKVALRLQQESIDHIYTSDLARAADTAKAIHAFHPQAPFIPTKDLRETYLGSWQGKTKQSLGLNSATEYTNTAAYPPEVETREQLYARITLLLERTTRTHSGNTVVFVAHSGVNRMLLSHVKGFGFQGVEQVEKQHNTAVSIVQFSLEKIWVVEQENSIDHLA